MEWIYVEDALPEFSPNADLPPICIVSAKKADITYVAIALYYQDQKLWLDEELHAHDVYAWCIPIPAKERTT
jgi:hypothetical protein